MILVLLPFVSFVVFGGWGLHYPFLVGSTLREVLKHNTLEQVVMVEIDEGIVEASRRYLPEWNDCSMLEGRAQVCMVRG